MNNSEASLHHEKCVSCGINDCSDTLCGGSSESDLNRFSTIEFQKFEKGLLLQHFHLSTYMLGQHVVCMQVSLIATDSCRLMETIYKVQSPFWLDSLLTLTISDQMLLPRRKPLARIQVTPPPHIYILHTPPHHPSAFSHRCRRCTWRTSNRWPLTIHLPAPFILIANPHLPPLY